MASRLTNNTSEPRVLRWTQVAVLLKSHDGGIGHADLIELMYQLIPLDLVQKSVIYEIPSDNYTKNWH